MVAILKDYRQSRAVARVRYRVGEKWAKERRTFHISTSKFRERITLIPRKNYSSENRAMYRAPRTLEEGRKEGRINAACRRGCPFFFFHVKRGRYFPQLAKLAGTLLKTNARGWCLTSPRQIVGGKKLRKSVPVLQAKFEARATNLIRRCHSENGNDRIGCNLNPIYIPPIRSRTRFSRTSVIKVLERVLLEPAVALNTRDA